MIVTEAVEAYVRDKEKAWPHDRAQTICPCRLPRDVA